MKVISGRRLKFGLVLISLFSLLIVVPFTPQYWLIQKAGFLPTNINDHVKWNLILPPSLEKAKIVTDGDCLTFAEEKVSVHNCIDDSKLVLWQSDPTWKVTEVISADLNRDKKNELVMVVWRPHQPWPIDSFLPAGGRIADFHDRSGMSCHLILVGWDGDKYRELWAGSSLIDPVFGIRAVDLDKDGFQELVALEGKYDNKNVTGNLTVWDWSGFGFRLRDRIDGSFSEFGIISVDEDVLILSD
jgi:hypothetical protein